MNGEPVAGEDPVEEGTETYRPVSWLAVAALVVGLLASLAIAGPGFWFVPLLGTALASAALASISRPGVAMVGRVAALAGLAMSVAAGCAGVSSWITYRRVAELRAIRVAEAWAGEIRSGDRTSARGMLVPEIATLVMGRPAEPRDTTDQETAGEESPVVAALANCGERARLVATCEEFVPASSQGPDTWRVRLRLGPCDAGDDRAFVVQVRRDLVREPRSSSGLAENWRITGVDGAGNPIR